MKHITGKAICWSLYVLVLGTLLYIGAYKTVWDIKNGKESGAVVAVLEAGAGAENTSKESKSKEPQIVTIEIKPTPTPIPTKRPRRAADEYPRNYKLSSKEVDKIAQLLWSSPLRSESAKETLVWVVLNRVDDESGMFGNSVEEVVKTSEFSFFDRHAHISDKNREIVREVMQAWCAEKDGYYVGSHCPKHGVYIRFEGENNRAIEVTGTIGGMPLEW